MSSALLSVYLSPSFPEYLWKVWIMSCMAFSRVEAFSESGKDILEEQRRGGRSE